MTVHPPSHTPQLCSKTDTPQESSPNSKPAHEGARSWTFTEMPLVRNREGEMAVLMEHDCFFIIYTEFSFSNKRKGSWTINGTIRRKEERG